MRPDSSTTALINGAAHDAAEIASPASRRPGLMLSLIGWSYSAANVAM